MKGLLISLLAILLGIGTGLSLDIPYIYSKYVAVAIIACIDSVLGAFVSNIQERFDIKVFLSGFFGNSLIAMFLTFIGEKLDADLYLAAILVFSTRIFNNFSTIRRYAVEKVQDMDYKKYVKGNKEK